MQHFRIREYSEHDIEALATAFADARPFPHVVLPGALRSPPEDVLGSFPSLDSRLWRRRNETYQPGKLTLSRIDRIPEPFAAMLRELMEPPALEFLERVSGIRRLLPDPYLDGGGLHCSTPGGVMAPHTDVHVNHRLDVYKRLILLVYLNPGWNAADGGCLEFYDDRDLRAPVRTILPAWGTMVILRSDARSVHGFTKPIAPTRDARRALALYYYTAARPSEFAGNELTDWRRHDLYGVRDDRSSVRRHARLTTYRALRLGAKAFAYLAHRAEPRSNGVG